MTDMRPDDDPAYREALDAFLQPVRFVKVDEDGMRVVEVDIHEQTRADLAERRRLRDESN